MHRKQCKKNCHPATLKPTFTGVIFKIDDDIRSQSMLPCVCRAESPSVVLPQTLLPRKLSDSFPSRGWLRSQRKPHQDFKQDWSILGASISLPCFWPSHLFSSSLCSSPPQGRGFLQPCKFQGVVEHLQGTQSMAKQMCIHASDNAGRRDTQCLRN